VDNINAKYVDSFDSGCRARGFDPVLVIKEAQAFPDNVINKGIDLAGKGFIKAKDLAGDATSAVRKNIPGLEKSTNLTPKAMAVGATAATAAGVLATLIYRSRSKHKDDEEQQ